MKKKMFLVLLLIGLMIIAACSRDKEALSIEKSKPVRVTELRKIEYPLVIEYIGTVVGKEMKGISFKNSGKIEKILVEEGEKITKEQELAKLETKDLILALDGARESMEATKAQYESIYKNAEINLRKAEDSYLFAEDIYNKLKRMYDEGAISKTKLDEAKLELDIRAADLEEAKYIEGKFKGEKGTLSSAYHQFKQAETNYLAIESQLDDATIKSNMEGYVVDIIHKEGEVVSAGMPVVVIRNENKVVNVGLTVEDIDRVKIMDKAIIENKNIEVEGIVTNINKTPDQETRTYNVEITPNKKNNPLKLGQIINVNIHIGKEKGIWIPVTAILSNSTDYVFVAEDNIAMKKEIRIVDMRGNMVKIEGLKPGENLIIEGMRNLNQNDSINILN